MRRVACGLTALWLVSQACLLAQADGTQRLAALLIPARGQVALTKEQADQIRVELLAWTDERIRRGLTVAQLNEQLAASGLLVPEALYKTDDIYQPFAGYLEKITSEPIQSASDLLQINLQIGMTCSFDQTAVIYRRNPLRRVGWINNPDTKGSVAWKLSLITVGSADPNGERIVAAGMMSGWCTSSLVGIQLRIWKLAGNEMRSLLMRDLGGRDEPIKVVIDRDSVAFHFARNARDTAFLVRSSIERYKVERDRATRISPLAVHILGFIEEWLGLDDAEAARWSSPEGTKEHASAVAWAKDKLVEYEGGSRCTGSPRLWQVSVKLSDAEDRRFFLVNEDGAESLQMAGFRSEPVRECPHVDVADLTKELSP